MALKDLNGLRSVEELQDYRRELADEVGSLAAQYEGLPFPEGEQERFASYQETISEIDMRSSELVARKKYVESLATSNRNTERIAEASVTRDARGTIAEFDLFDASTLRVNPLDPEAGSIELRDRALRIIERTRFPHERAKTDVVRDHLMKLMDTVDDPVALARHLFWTGSPAYQRAFAKSAFRTGGLTREESVALERAMTLSPDTAGGAAVPFMLDPTLIPTSDGAVNPLRQISRIVQITGKEWQGVTTAGVTAGRSAEGAESGDDSPTLAQPQVPTSKVDVFIPFSIELGLAWGSIQSDMAQVLQDAKDEEEASSFVNGTGVAPEPGGVVQSLADTSIIWTQASGNFGVEDVYALETDTATGASGNGLPPRFRPRASILANKAIFNRVRQFDTQGGAALWVRLGDGLPPELIGYPAYEASEMDAGLTNGNDIMLIGDFRYYIIVDRIGLTVELIPHLFHTANNRPSGQRGLYAHWHNGAEVLSSNAFRKLRVGEGS